MMENEIMKMVESGSIIALLTAGVFLIFKTYKTLYEGRIQE